MQGERKPPAAARAKAAVDLVTLRDATLVSVVGLVDERFGGFGDVGATKTLVIDVSGITRMTSFGVRQWLNSMEALPKSISDLYLLGCPTFFVDQLNMVLNFGGAGQILTVVAPYSCASCGIESGQAIDVLAERAALAKGAVPEKECARCGSKLEFDETPESYFSFVPKYAASSIQPSAAQLLSSRGLYTALGTAAEKPPRIIKLVHGSVTYFRIIGTIGAMFRARPFLVGAEGEVVIDLAEVDRFDAAGLKEWRRLLKSLTGQVPAVSLVDVNESFLASAGESFGLARNISVWSVLVPYRCVDCGRMSSESHELANASWPLQFPEHVCSTCGGTARNELLAELLPPLQKATTDTPVASAKLIKQRDEVLSRALTDANVAQAGDGATASLTADDTILGKYKMVRRLSAGGMAEVFLAKQVGIGGFEKPVALKRIQRKLLETRHLAIDMFLNEAKIAGRLTHPNIVQVLDVGEVGGALYLAMEYVHGKDLRDLVKKLRSNRTMLPLAEACYVIREVAQALDHAYWSTDMAGKQLSVVHRDVSPHNIILGYDGTVKLLDFGVAMSAVTEQAEKTMIVGKWLYMSPEATTSEQIDHRSDLFSLGVIMYLLCSGTMPFNGPDPKRIVAKIRAGQFQPLREIVPQIPEQLASLVGRLLAANPNDRPARGKDVVAELTEITRQHGIESSAQNIAQFLSNVFPDDGNMANNDAFAIPDIVKILPDESIKERSRTTGEQGYTHSDGSPVSVTPTSVSGRFGAVDVSQTYRQTVPEGADVRPSTQSLSILPRTITPHPAPASKRSTIETAVAPPPPPPPTHAHAPAALAHAPALAPAHAPALAPTPAPAPIARQWIPPAPLPPAPVARWTPVGILIAIMVAGLVGVASYLLFR